MQAAAPRWAAAEAVFTPRGGQPPLLPSTTGLAPTAGSLRPLQDEGYTCPRCGNVYMCDSNFCRKCGHHRPLAAKVLGSVRSVGSLDRASRVTTGAAEPCEELTCRTCGTGFTGDANFCRICGRQRFQAAAERAAPAGAPPPPAGSAYQAADDLLENFEQLGTGYLDTLTPALPPAQWVERLTDNYDEFANSPDVPMQEHLRELVAFDEAEGRDEAEYHHVARSLHFACHAGVGSLEKELRELREEQLDHRLAYLERLATGVVAQPHGHEEHESQAHRGDHDPRWHAESREFRERFLPETLFGYWIDKRKIKRREAQLERNNASAARHPFIYWLAGKSRKDIEAESWLVEHHTWHETKPFVKAEDVEDYYW